MTCYFIAPDGDHEPTLWVATSEEPRLADHSHPRAIARRCDIPPELWALARALADPGRLGGGTFTGVVRHALQTAVRSELSERTEAH